MKTEIERKFLLAKDAFLTKPLPWESPNEILQGYLYNKGDHSVRVRKSSNGDTLTYKGKLVGCTRSEREFNLWSPIASMLLLLCGKVLKKTRYTLIVSNDVWEVDVFNSGLMLAEIELPSEDHVFDKPYWVGEEVTYDSRYYNVNLIKGRGTL